MSAIRIEKINAVITHELPEIFKGIKDPRFDGIVTVTDVSITNDFSHCNIKVSIYNAKDKDLTFKILNKSSSFIRHELANKIDLRIMPELHFLMDNSLDYVDKMNALFKKI